jgi:hypothetical protein
MTSSWSDEESVRIAVKVLMTSSWLAEDAELSWRSLLTSTRSDEESCGLP